MMIVVTSRDSAQRQAMSDRFPRFGESRQREMGLKRVRS